MRFLSLFLSFISFLLLWPIPSTKRSPCAGCNMIGPTMAMDRGSWTISIRQLTDPILTLFLGPFLSSSSSSFSFSFLLNSAFLRLLYPTKNLTRPNQLQDSKQAQQYPVPFGAKENYSTTATSLPISSTGRLAKQRGVVVFC